VVPVPNNGDAEIVGLRKSSDHTCFMFQKLKYVWNDERKVFRGIEFPLDHSFGYYLNWRGHETEEEVAEAEKKLGNNA
jgi:cation-transporting ATPase 13A1